MGKSLYEFRFDLWSRNVGSAFLLKIDKETEMTYQGNAYQLVVNNGGTVAHDNPISRFRVYGDEINRVFSYSNSTVSVVRVFADDYAEAKNKAIDVYLLKVRDWIGALSASREPVAAQKSQSAVDKNLISAVMQYAMEYSWTDFEAIDTLVSCGITFEDFEQAGYGDYVKSYFEDEFEAVSNEAVSVENSKLAHFVQLYIDELEYQGVPHAEIVHLLLGSFSRNQLESLGFGDFIEDCLDCIENPSFEQKLVDASERSEKANVATFNKDVLEKE